MLFRFLNCNVEFMNEIIFIGPFLDLINLFIVINWCQIIVSFGLFLNNINILCYLINIEFLIVYIKITLYLFLIKDWAEIPLPGVLNTKIFIYLSWINEITILILFLYNKSSNIQKIF